MNISFIGRISMAILVVASALVGCDIETFEDANSSFGGTNPPPPPGPPPPPPPPPPAAFGPNFSEIQANVFTPSCATAGCHDAGTSAGSLNLEDANSYAELVGIASDDDAGILRVAPTDPTNSYLIQKMEGTAATGAVMPPGGALVQSTIDIIRQWITDGAIDDRMQSSLPVRVSSLSTAPGLVLTAPPTQIIAGFDRELNATSIDRTTFILEASGADGTFGDGNEARISAASISVPFGNPQTAVLDLTGIDLADDTYRVMLLGTGATVIMDLDGNALDGEFAAAFPSGNGVAGSVFQAQFVIKTKL